MTIAIDDCGSSKSAELLGAFGFVELQDLPEEVANKLLQVTVELGFGKAVAIEEFMP